MLNLTEQVKESLKQTGAIQIQHPLRPLKTVHRKPYFKRDSVYIQLMRGWYKVVGHKKLGILDVFEVE